MPDVRNETKTPFSGYKRQAEAARPVRSRGSRTASRRHRAQALGARSPGRPLPPRQARGSGSTDAAGRARAPRGVVGAGGSAPERDPGWGRGHASEATGITEGETRSKDVACRSSSLTRGGGGPAAAPDARWFDPENGGRRVSCGPRDARLGDRQSKEMPSRGLESEASGESSGF